MLQRNSRRLRVKKSADQAHFSMSSTCRRRCSSKIILRKCTHDSRRKTLMHISRSKRCRLLTMIIPFNISIRPRSMGPRFRASRKSCTKKLYKSKRKSRFQREKSWKKIQRKRPIIWTILSRCKPVWRSLLSARAPTSCQHRFRPVKPL